MGSCHGSQMFLLLLLLQLRAGGRGIGCEILTVS